MRLAKASGGFLAALVISLCFAPGISAQAMPANKPKPVARAKAAAPPKAAAAAKPAAPAKTAGPPKAAASAKPAAAPGEEPAPETAEVVNKRDPFASLINEKKETTQHLPPGKAGLVIATVRVDGAVRSPSGMIAIVSNPSNAVYFVREGDRLYDGDVEKIGLDGVTFKEESRDAFGNAVERTVTKRIYAIAGEQQ